MSKGQNTASATVILRADNLHKYLGEGEMRNHTLRGVSLELHPALTYAVVGESGSGKSTLLYLLGLLDQQDDGEIYIRGEKMSEASDRRRTRARSEHIGFVFQFHFLLPEFSALENVMMPMRKLGKLRPAQMAVRAGELLDQVGLGDKKHRLATQLSGGEQQRVSIARALANEPALILADEPTGNLDTATSDKIFELLVQFSHEVGHAILMVTHNRELASRCDHTLMMQDGVIVGKEDSRRESA